MTIDPSIFKAYDIRGIYPAQLNEEVAYKIARAYAEIIKRENKDKEKIEIVVGHDMRLSSPSLKEQTIRGLIDSGVDVIDIGLATTPTFYFAVAFYGFLGGMQVSASHNPKEYNGFKMVRAGAVPVSGEKGIYEMRDMVIAGNFPISGQKGIVTEKDGVVDEEIKEQIQDKNIHIDKIKPFKIVVDTANAMAILDIKAMFKSLKCDLVLLNSKLDGTFPVHQPDPLDEKNLEVLKKSVVQNKADLGIGPDGDGDRYFFIDEKGEVIRQEILRGIMAQIALKENPGETVCYDIRPGRITKDMIEAVGGKASVTKVGHSLIKEQMLREHAIFGGESSGHYFYQFPYGTFEAPIVLTLKFLEYLSWQNKPVSGVIAPYKVYFHSGEINSEVADKGKKIKEIAQNYVDAVISYLDGITVEYPDFWFNVRPSNTESLLRLNLEAKSEELMRQKRDEVLDLIRS